MKKIIHHVRHIRKQPEEVRRHLLHVITGVCAFILFVLWIFSLGAKFTNDRTGDRAEKDLEPFSALKANFVGGYNSITD